MKELVGGIYNLGKDVFDTGFDLTTAIADGLVGKYHPKTQSYSRNSAGITLLEPL